VYLCTVFSLGLVSGIHPECGSGFCSRSSICCSCWSCLKLFVARLHIVGKFGFSMILEGGKIFLVIIGVGVAFPCPRWRQFSIFWIWLLFAWYLRPG